MSLLLALDTSTPTGSVALSRNGLLVGELLLHLKTTHSERLLSSVEHLLNDTGVALADVAAIAVVTGPGSFTGLRVGVASAKALAHATGKPLLPVSSLEALTFNAPYAALEVCPMLDARKGEVYTALFRTAHGMPERILEDRVVPPEEFLAGLSGQTLFLGDGARAWRSLIVRRLGPRAHFLPSVCDQIRAGHVAALASRRFAEGDVGDPVSVNPRYLRLSEAEIASRRRETEGSIEG